MKSFVSKLVFDGMRPLPVLKTSNATCIGITGEPLHVEGTIHTELSFPSSGIVSYSGNFLVSSNLFQPLQCVLGWDFLTYNGLQLSFAEGGAYSRVGAHGITPQFPIILKFPSHLSQLPCLMGIPQLNLTRFLHVCLFSLQVRGQLLSHYSQIYVLQVELKFWPVVNSLKVIKIS